LHPLPALLSHKSYVTTRATLEGTLNNTAIEKIHGCTEKWALHGTAAFLRLTLADQRANSQDFHM